jgi:hypothetical protein
LFFSSQPDTVEHIAIRIIGVFFWWIFQDKNLSQRGVQRKFSKLGVGVFFPGVNHWLLVVMRDIL